MLKNVTIFFLIIILIGLSNASIDKLPQAIKQNECVNLPQNEINSTYQNITYVQLPNNETINIGSLMTKYGTSYKYYFCNTSVVGTYLVNGHSDLSSWSYWFDVTPTGINQTGERVTITTVAILSMFGVCVLMFVAFIYFKHPTARISFGVLSFIFLVAGLNLILNSLTNEVVDPNVINLFDFIGAASYYFYWLGGGIIIITLFVTGLVSLFSRYSKLKMEKYNVQ